MTELTEAVEHDSDEVELSKDSLFFVFFEGVWLFTLLGSRGKWLGYGSLSGKFILTLKSSAS